MKTFQILSFFALIAASMAFAPNQVSQGECCQARFSNYDLTRTRAVGLSVTASRVAAVVSCLHSASVRESLATLFSIEFLVRMSTKPY